MNRHSHYQYPELKTTPGTVPRVHYPHVQQLAYPFPSPMAFTVAATDSSVIPVPVHGTRLCCPCGSSLAVETPEGSFRILKRVFHYTKVRYRGIKKNHERLLTAFALVNLYQYRKRSAQLGA